MIALARDNAGRLWEARIVTTPQNPTAGKVNVRHQNTPGGTWGLYTDIQGGTPAGLFDMVAISCNGDGLNAPNGRMEVIAMHSAFQVLYRNWMNSAGAWQSFVTA